MKLDEIIGRTTVVENCIKDFRECLIDVSINGKTSTKYSKLVSYLGGVQIDTENMEIPDDVFPFLVEDENTHNVRSIPTLIILIILKYLVTPLNKDENPPTNID